MLDLGALYVAVFAFVLIDILCAEKYLVRVLPRYAWFLVAIVAPVVGPIAWVVFGRPRHRRRVAPRGAGAQFPEYDRPGRYIPTDPDADAAFLQKLRDRAEEQRRVAREQRDTGD